MKYKVCVLETLLREIIVEADTEDDAKEIVKKQYDNSEIILDSSDYVEHEIYVKEEEN